MSIGIGESAVSSGEKSQDYGLVDESVSVDLFYKNTDRRRTGTFYVTFFLISFICLFMQAAIEFSYNNIISSIFAFTGANTSMYYTIFKNNISKTPISSMSILGLGVTTSAFPLVSQTVLFTPTSYNLNYPLETFGVGTITVILAVGIHFLYKKIILFNVLKNIIRNNILKPLGIFRRLSWLDLIAAGFFGILCTIYTTGYSDDTAIQTGDALGKFLQAFKPFAGAPVIGLFPSIYGGRRKIPNWAIASYLIIMLFVAALANGRGIIVTLLTNVILIFVIQYFSGRWKSTKNNIFLLMFVLFFSVVLLPVISRVSDAIVAVRTERAKLSQIELLNATVAEVINPRPVFDKFNNLGGYSETYSSSKFINRFVSVKFTDNVISSSKQLDSSKSNQVRIDFQKRVLSSFPQPILDVLKLDAGKNDRPFSSGDIYAFLSGKYPELGAFLTGSSLGDCLFLFGIFFPIAYGAVILGLFILKDTWAIPRRYGDEMPVISVCGLLVITRVFMAGLETDSYSGLILEILRGYIQTTLCAAVIFFLARNVVNLLGLGRLR